jgi:O-antigen/teichoic acid export membrane protein
MSQPTEMARAGSKDVAALLARTIFTRVLAVLRSIVILPLIGPGELGALRYLLTLTSYASYLHGGALTIFGMRYPAWIAGEKPEKASAVQALAFQVVLVGATVAVLAILGVLAWTRTAGVWLSIAVASLAGVQLIASFVSVSFRAHGEFRGMAKNEMLVTLVSFVAALVGAYLLGVGGLILASVLSAVVGVVAAKRWLFPAGWTRIDRSLIRSELPYGMVLMSTSVLNQVSMSIDLVIIKPYFPNGDAGYGYYAFGAMLASLVYALMDSLAQVQANRMYKASGLAEGAMDSVLDELERCAVRETLAAVVVVSMVALALGIAIPVFLHGYWGALPILGLFLWAAVLLRLRTYPAIFLNIVKANRWATLASALAIGATVAHVWVVHRWFSNSLVGFALCSAVAYTFTFAIGAIGAYAAVDRLRRLARFGPLLLLAIAPTALFGALCFVPYNRLPHAYVAAGIAVPLLVAVIVARAFPEAYRSAIQMAVRLYRRDPQASSQS